MDYYREYITTIDLLANNLTNKHSRYLEVGDVTFAKPIKNHLCILLMLNGSREVYNKLRKSGATQNEALNKINDLYLNNFQPIDSETISKKINTKFEAYEYLKKFEGSIVVFCFNYRQLNLWHPLISKLNEKILVLCNFHFNEDIQINGDITFLELCFIPEEIIINSYLKRSFPIIYQYANLFMMLVKVIVPSKVLVMEGCHSETEILAAICKRHSINTICYQQGWPSVIHTRFRDMGYDEFITWGWGFNNLWKKYNPNTKFVAGSYPYKISNSTKTKAITFFLQAPIVIIDYEYFIQILLLAKNIAIACPEYKILIREHPEFKLSKEQLDIFKTVQNIRFVTIEPLYDVFSITLISVSVFSSTIIESLVHSSIPFIFDMSTDGHYYPSTDGWAIESNTYDDAYKKLYELATNQQKQKFYLQEGVKFKKLFFDKK